MKKWRWQSWALVAWAIAAVVISAAVLGSASDAKQAGYLIGEMAWVCAIGFAVLAIVWRQTRPSPAKSCPRCGVRVPMSAPSCPNCSCNPS
jgi:hypothetical protein